MLKLYKLVGGVLHYWEVWQETERKLLVHTGALGDTGAKQSVPMHKGESEDDAIGRVAEERRSDGYGEIDPDDLDRVIIQYAVAGWGSTKDLERREAIEHVLNETLGWTGNGHCDGGDIGSGTINLFCFVVDASIAARSIIAALEVAEQLAGAVIAVQPSDEAQPAVVVWPRDHDRPFSLFGETTPSTQPPAVKTRTVAKPKRKAKAKPAPKPKAKPAPKPKAKPARKPKPKPKAKPARARSRAKPKKSR